MIDKQDIEVLTLTDIATVLRRHLLILIAGMLGGATIATATTFLITPVFRAEALVAPTKSEDARSGLSGITGQLGGLASLAGLPVLGGSAGDRAAEAIATLQSRTLTQDLVADDNLLPVLFVGKWDASAKNWKSSEPGYAPTLWDANRVFAEKIRKISEDKKTGMVTISIDWPDPVLAARWASELIRRTNQLLRDGAIAKSEKNIAFLHNQLNQTGVIEIRQSIYRLLEVEIQGIMLAQGSDDYAFKIIDPPTVPEEPISPRRTLITALGAFGGLLIAAALVLLARPPRSISS